jgi:hypothetical protein
MSQHPRKKLLSYQGGGSKVPLFLVSPPAAKNKETGRRIKIFRPGYVYAKRCSG